MTDSLLLARLRSNWDVHFLQKHCSDIWFYFIYISTAKLHKFSAFSFVINLCEVVWPRNSHRRCSVRRGVHRNFPKITEEHLPKTLFFNKVAGLRLATTDDCFWAEVYSEPCQITKVEPIYKNSGYKLLTIFAKYSILTCLTGFWIRFFR